MYRGEVHGMWGTEAPATPPPHSWGLRGWAPGRLAARGAAQPKGTCAGGSVGVGLVSGVALLPWPMRSQGVGECREWSLLLLSGGDSDQLFGSLGDVISALDHLLSQQLEVHRGPRLRGHCLPALALQPVGAGIEQPQ